jgi:hypothetical protein
MTGFPRRCILKINSHCALVRLASFRSFCIRPKFAHPLKGYKQASMARHSKNNCASSVFSYAEKQKMDWVRSAHFDLVLIHESLRVGNAEATPWQRLTEGLESVLVVLAHCNGAYVLVRFLRVRLVLIIMQSPRASVLPRVHF